MALSRLLLHLFVLSILSMSASAIDCDNLLPNCACIAPQNLELECVNITVWPQDLPASVTELVISNSALEKIPVLSPSNQNLNVLVVENSTISDIADDAFQNVPSLGLLKIESCKLNALRAEMFNGMNENDLTVLNLRDNAIQVIPTGIFDKLRGVKKLTLSENPLKLTPNTFELINEELDTFECIHCGLEAVPTEAFQYMPMLQKLVLNRNKFTSLDDGSFKSVKDLKHLELDACEIETISSSAFDGLEKLEMLELGFNKLKEIPEDAFDDLENLKVLKLENNQLNTLDENLLASTSIKSLTVALQGNSWRCDCDLYWMKDVQFEGENSVICASPEEYMGLDVHNATQAMSCDSGRSDGSTIAIAIAIPVIIICVALIGYYVYKIIQARRKRSDQRKSVRYSSVYGDTTEPKSRRPTSEL